MNSMLLFLLLLFFLSTSAVGISNDCDNTKCAPGLYCKINHGNLTDTCEPCLKFCDECNDAITCIKCQNDDLRYYAVEKACLCRAGTYNNTQDNITCSQC